MQYTEYRKTRENINKVNRTHQKKLELIKYKGGKCEICGYDKLIPLVYDFHHIDPNNKTIEVSKILSKKPLDELKLEVDKCQLLCANCHRELHYQLHQNQCKKHLEQIELYGPIIKQQRKLTRSQNNKKYNCQSCNEKCNPRATLCIQCYRNSITKKKPTKNILQKLVWEKPKTKIAEDYNVSGKAVEKWCKKYNITCPPKGYWLNKKTG